MGKRLQTNVQHTMTTTIHTNNELTPKEAYTWLTQITPGCRNDDLEKIIAKDVNYAFDYAFCALGKKRFKLGEPVIATDAGYACSYAINMIKGRFELGEPAIAKNGHWSFWYARDVIKGRWELGEPAIATNSWWSYDYACFIAKCRFELGELGILESRWAEEYKQKFNMR